jgi:hypothetical protein
MVPTYLEQLIHQGRAEFKSYSGFATENHIIKVPDSTYIIIYEYWYKPQWELDGTTDLDPVPDIDYRNFISYVHIFTGNKYHPFFHKPVLVNSNQTIGGTLPNPTAATTISYSGIPTDYRSCYIGSNRDVSIYFTRLTSANTTYNPVTIPPINSFQANLGYANEAIAGRIARFNQGAPLTHYGPLQQPYSQIGGLTSIEYSQAFTIPGTGNGSVKPPETIYGSDAQKSMRQLFFHCNYIQVNEQAPKTLI